MNALERPDLIAIADLSAGEQVELIQFLRSTFQSKSRDDWIKWFVEKDVAFSPVLDFREAFDLPNIAERGLLVEHEGAHYIAPAIRFAGEKWTLATAPELDADG